MDYDHLDAYRTIQDAEQLCAILLREIAVDVLVEQRPYNLEPADSSEEEKLMMRRRMKPYMSRLPEYQYLIDSIFQ